MGEDGDSLGISCGARYRDSVLASVHEGRGLVRSKVKLFQVPGAVVTA
jgi:hypothetical protein